MKRMLECCILKREPDLPINLHCVFTVGNFALHSIGENKLTSNQCLYFRLESDVFTEYSDHYCVHKYHIWNHFAHVFMMFL